MVHILFLDWAGNYSSSLQNVVLISYSFFGNLGKFYICLQLDTTWPGKFHLLFIVKTKINLQSQNAWVLFQYVTVRYQSMGACLRWCFAFNILCRHNYIRRVWIVVCLNIIGADVISVCVASICESQYTSCLKSASPSMHQVGKNISAESEWCRDLIASNDFGMKCTRRTNSSG